MKSCYFCKGLVEVRRIEHIHRWQGKIYLFRNIEAEVCSQCGEVFLLPEALKYMDKIAQSPGKAEKEITIPVFSAPKTLTA